MYISSADFMTRNMERRVEVAAPIYDETIRARILRLVDLEFSDNVKGRRLLENGEYTPVKNQKPPTDSQIDLYKAAYMRAENAAARRAAQPVTPRPRTADGQKKRQPTLIERLRGLFGK